MKMNKKYITYGTLALLLGIGGYLLIRRKQKQKMAGEINDILDGKIADPNKGGGQNIIAKTDYDKLPNGNFPAKIGDKNKKIYGIQQMLNKTFGSNIDLDGKYGESTFQTLCTNLWNKGFSYGIPNTYETACIDHSLSGRTRRMITQADYDKIMAGKF